MKILSKDISKTMIVLLLASFVLLSITKGFSQEINWYTTDQGGGISTDNSGDIKLNGVI